MNFRFADTSRELFAAWQNHSAIYPMEYHRQVEICHVRSGSLTLTLADATYTLQEGDMYIIFPYVHHAVEVHSSSKRLWMFSPDLLPELTTLLTTRKPLCPVLRASEMSSLIRNLFNRCVDLWLKQRERSRSLMVAHTASLMHELLQKLELTQWGADQGVIQRLTGYLMENFHRDITLEEAATVLGYSKFYVSHTISQMYGCNFRTLVNNYRISAAQDALVHTSRDIWQIAYDCGFQNQSTFNRAFLKVCGMTPTQYRKTAQN